jgi:putative transposase
MGAVLKLTREVRDVAELPAALGVDRWAAAPAAQRRVAELRQALVAPLAALVEGGASISHAAELFHTRAAARVLDPTAAHVLAMLNAAEADDATPADLASLGHGGAPSVPTLKRWISAYRRDGKAGLLPRHTGRVRQAYGWEVRAVAEFNLPSKPGYADVAWRLRAEGWASATESRVKRYLKKLPATLGPLSPARVGPHLHRLTRQRFQRRHLDDVLVGEIYTGDGHTVDCYVAHPNTGKPYRPELTLFMDVKSRAPVGWWFTESESAHSTMFALSHAMACLQHVPAWVYIDRGAGYRAKMLNDEAVGWYRKFDIEPIGALPGNPHGKGWIERFFRTCRDKHDKFFAGGAVYCGDDMAPEVNRRLSAELQAGRRTLPPLDDYVRSFAGFIGRYMDEPMDVLHGRTPAQLMAELTPVALHLDATALMRPSKLATVRRQEVRLHNRFYFHEALALYDGKQVRVEYDIHDDRLVSVHDTKGRLICEAKKSTVIGVLPISRIEEGRDRREKGQVKRLEAKLDEVHKRRRDPITAETQVLAIEQLQAADAPALPATAGTDAPLPTPAPPPKGKRPTPPAIDILDWRNDR